MPLYEYECPRCKTVTERLLSIEDMEKTQVNCKECKTLCDKLLSEFSVFEPKTVGRLAEQNTLRQKGLSF